MFGIMISWDLIFNPGLAVLISWSAFASGQDFVFYVYFYQFS